jgi:hypothetical protein
MIILFPHHKKDIHENSPNLSILYNLFNKKNEQLINALLCHRKQQEQRREKFVYNP